MHLDISLSRLRGYIEAMREMQDKDKNAECHCSVVEELLSNVLEGLVKEQIHYQRVMNKTIKTTQDDDTHEFLNRVLIGLGDIAPPYRIKIDN